jgi:hypothetical protein
MSISNWTQFQNLTGRGSYAVTMLYQQAKGTYLEDTVKGLFPIIETYVRWGNEQTVDLAKAVAHYNNSFLPEYRRLRKDVETKTGFSGFVVLAEESFQEDIVTPIKQTIQAIPAKAGEFYEGLSKPIADVVKAIAVLAASGMALYLIWNALTRGRRD